MTEAIIIAFVVLCILNRCAVFCCHRAKFNANRVATSETRMWQAYYGGHRLWLFWELLRQLQAQFSLTFVEAVRVGRLLARSAMRFKAARDHYEEAALPDLIKAYDRIRLATGSGFDAETVARAELSWWVARRTPNEKSPETVGQRIGELYTAYYQIESPLFEQAGIRRAEAAHLRYLGHPHPDWAKIRAMLIESYRLLDRGRRAANHPAPVA